MTQIRLARSFAVAVRGFWYELVEERNIKIQMMIALYAIGFSIFLDIPRTSFLLILSVSFLVVILELLNTGFEKMIDVISPEYDKDLGRVKDILAAAVLLSSILSVIVGVFILYKPVIEFVTLVSNSILNYLIMANLILVFVVLLIWIKKK